jgi:hypothetical protein
MIYAPRAEEMKDPRAEHTQAGRGRVSASDDQRAGAVSGRTRAVAPEAVGC